MTTSRRTGKTRPQDIAIVGMSVWYPGSVSLTEFWENILAKRQQFRAMPDCRLPKDQYFSADRATADKTYGQEAALIDGFEYDWQSRRIPRKTFESTDIVHWLALEVALKAVDDAKLDVKKLREIQTGVILGNTLTGEWTRTNAMRLRWPFFAKVMRETAANRGLNTQAAEDLIKHAEYAFKSVFPTINEDTLAGALSNTIAGRICNYLDLHGGGFTVDGACSSSLLAVLTAIQHLTTGNLDVALTGGIDVSLDTFELIGFAKTGALTPDEMRVYDRRANGFIPGEGCGFMVLKRLEDAVADQDQIYAVIKGWGLSSDGKGGLTAPTVAGQAQAINKAYAMAGYQVKDLHFVEGHGTGTTLGDKVEISALQAALGDGIPAQKIALTSLKSILGHTKAAAGIGALIKAAIAVNQRIVPPIAGVEEPNDLFKSHAPYFYPATEGRKFDEALTLRAGVSAMGFGGINTHVTLESYDAPAEHLRSYASDTMLLNSHDRSEAVIFTAPSQSALQKILKIAVNEASGMSRSELGDFAFERSRLCRSDDRFRAITVVKSPKDLSEAFSTLLHWLESPIQDGAILEAQNQKSYTALACRAQGVSEQPKIGFMFPGQGSQKVQMGLSMINRSPWAKAKAEAATQLMSKHGIDLLQALSVGVTNGKSLKDTEIAQPAISLVNALTFEMLGKLGIKPSAVSGHSLGELSGLFAAGSISFEKLIELSAHRGSVMGAPADKAGTMGYLTCSKTKADELLAMCSAENPAGYLTVANYNGPDQVVISGDPSLVDWTLQKADSMGITGGRLPVSNAFHSKYMTDGAAKFAQFLDKIEFRSLKVNFVSGHDGKVLDSDSDLRSYLTSQMQDSVDFVASFKALADRCDVIFEVGPGAVLTNLGRKILMSDADYETKYKNKKIVATLAQPGQDMDLKVALGVCYVRGCNVRWNELFAERFFRPFTPAHQRSFITSPTERPLSFLETAVAVAPDFLSAVVPAPRESVVRDLPTHTSQLSTTSVAAPTTTTTTTSTPAEPMLGQSSDGDTTKSPAPLTLATVLSSLYLEISQLTGFDQSSLNPEMTLLDDLHLDSIKATEFIGNISMQYNVASEFADLHLNNAKLSEIAQLVLQHRPSEINKTSVPSSIPSAPRTPAPSLNSPGQAASVAAPQVVAANIPHVTTPPTAKAPVQPRLVDVSPYVAQTSRAKNREPWTRNFSEVFADAPLDSSLPAVSWTNQKVLVVAQMESDLENGFLSELKGSGAHVEVLLMDDEHKATLNLQNYTTVIAFMPKRDAAKLNHVDQSMRLLSNLAKSKFARSQNVVFIQVDDGLFGKTRPSRISAKAFAQSLAHERPDLIIRTFSIHEDLTGAQGGQTSLESVKWSFFSQLSRELQLTQKLVVAGFKQGSVRVAPVLKLDRPSSYSKRLVKWTANDVVLVTGGAKGITAECAYQFALKHQVKVVLIGSSPLDESANQAENPIRQTLDRYRAAGLTASYYACNITDQVQVQKTVEHIQEIVGTITGIIHGAGVNQPKLLHLVDFVGASREVHPKVLGMQNILNAVDPKQLKIVLALTSVIGVVGMPGNGWYGFANENLDLLLRSFQQKHPHIATQSLAYSVWSEIGMGARLGSDKLLEDKGISAIPPHEGVARFLKLAESQSVDQQTIITSRLGSIQLSA